MKSIFAAVLGWSKMAKNDITSVRADKAKMTLGMLCRAQKLTYKRLELQLPNKGNSRRPDECIARFPIFIR